MIRLTARREVSTEQRGGDVVLETPSRWVRAAGYYGTPPGSRWGVWRTRSGAMRGWNLRLGKHYVGPCLIVFLHTRPQRREGLG